MSKSAFNILEIVGRYVIIATLFSPLLFVLTIAASAAFGAIGFILALIVAFAAIVMLIVGVVVEVNDMRKFRA